MYFLLKVQYDDYKVGDIKNDYRETYNYSDKPDVIVSINSSTESHYSFLKLIYKFCKKYGNQLFDGIDILDNNKKR